MDLPDGNRRRPARSGGIYGIRHIGSNIGYLARVLRRKPRLAVRIARNYAKLAFDHKRPPLRFVDIAVSYKCNLRCSHCSALEMQEPGKPVLSAEQYRGVADKLIDAGAVLFNFTGGEPLLRKDIFEVIKAFQPEKTLIAIQTNGTKVTREKLLRLRELGVDSIGVSIDAADPALHDRFRNSPGAYDKAVRTLEMASAIGFNTLVSFCLTHDNLYTEDRQSVVRLAEKYNSFVTYSLAAPIGFWKGKSDNLITPEDRVFLAAELARHPRTKTDFETNYLRKGCGAIKEKLYVTAYGDVMPCPFIQVKFGNLLEDDVDTIRARAYQYQYFQEYTPHCLAAEDRDFIANTLCYGEEADQAQLPVWHEHAFRDRAAATGPKRNAGGR
jgi:MoaA/NifB/PqqE/SkfB family radical SAM enzyme